MGECSSEEGGGDDDCKLVVKTPVRVVKAEARYLEHVCIAVMRVLYHHRLGSRQSVRDAVLVFVAYGLVGQREERIDQYREDH